MPIRREATQRPTDEVLSVLREEIYRRLEEKMISYEDMAHIPTTPNSEELLPVGKVPGVRTSMLDEQMLPITGKQIYVRSQVVSMLYAVGRALLNCDRHLELEIVYGYRAPSVQASHFSAQSLAISLENPEYTEAELFEATNRRIASPDVAGHPTGGAVDVQIIQDGEPLDFGTGIWTFGPDSYTHSPFISKSAWKNRQLLRRLMLHEGFAPFDGEWWHFSFGDQEWAAYYGKPCATYDRVTFERRK